MKTPGAPAPLGVHCWADVAWWDQVRGVFNEASSLPHPSLPRPSPVPRRPSLACPLSYMWHGCLLLLVTSQAVRWPLHFWCWQAKLERRQPVYTCAHGRRAQTHTCSHTGFKGNIIQEEEEFPNDQTQAAWWVFASPRLCCLSVFISEVRHCFCLSFTSCRSLFFVLIFIFLSILARVFLFVQKAFRCNFISCFTFFKN